MLASVVARAVNGPHCTGMCVCVCMCVQACVCVIGQHDEGQDGRGAAGLRRREQLERVLEGDMRVSAWLTQTLPPRVHESRRERCCLHEAPPAASKRLPTDQHLLPITTAAGPTSSCLCSCCSFSRYSVCPTSCPNWIGSGSRARGGRARLKYPRTFGGPGTRQGRGAAHWQELWRSPVRPSALRRVLVGDLEQALSAGAVTRSSSA
jgi:hypothetical protein